MVFQNGADENIWTYEEVVGCWRKLHKEERDNLYHSRNMIKMMKPWRMRWAGHVARIVEIRNAYKILV